VDAIRRHPVISAIFLAGFVGGAVAGYVWLPDDWALLRRIAAGAVAGGGAAVFITATNLLR
jgi:hypothetical protein